ncbi:MAG TPA: DUF3500 domain-containing protein [Verrucomicrobiae bacterium]
MPQKTVACPDCDSSLSRRDFIKTSALGVAALAAAPELLAKDKALPKSEALVVDLYGTLSEEQKKTVCFPFGHELQSKVDNNWHITKPTLTDFYTKDQQEMVKQIFLGLHSEEYAQTVIGQVAHDSGAAGFGASSLAIFGEPGKGKFQFVLTGRHCTRRCDNDSVPGVAFGGPIFYGHAAKSFNEDPNHEGNVYWYQAKRANEVFKALDGKQREVALLGESRAERGTRTVALTGKKSGLPGIRVGDMSKDQRELVQKVMSDLLMPFRKSDSEEAMKYMKKQGVENLHMAFYKDEDVGKDGLWDVWQIEGPSMVWYFRGDPHVHTWVHVKETV